MKKIIFVLTLILPITCFSDVNSCAAFLTLGTYNLAELGNDTDTDLFKKASFCSSEYNPKSAQATLIESAYELFGGSDLAGIGDAQKRLCNGFGSDIYIRKTSQPTQNLFQDSIQEWNNCQTLAQKGVDFIMQPTRNLQSFSFTLSTSLGNQEKFLGLAQGGFGRSICKATFFSREGSGLKLKTIAADETTALPFDYNNKLQITCNRQMQKDSNGDFSAEAQTLELKTGKGAYQVEMNAIGALSKMSVDKVMANVQTSFQSQPKICTGSSLISAKWESMQWSIPGKHIVVDTSKCGFTKIPRYFTSLISNADDGQGLAMGYGGIINSSISGFETYVFKHDGTSIADDWVINWIAIQE